MSKQTIRRGGLFHPSCLVIFEQVTYGPDTAPAPLFSKHLNNFKKQIVMGALKSKFNQMLIL